MVTAGQVCMLAGEARWQRRAMARGGPSGSRWWSWQVWSTMVLTWGGEGCALPLVGCWGDPGPKGPEPIRPEPMGPDPVSCLTMPEPSCWSRPEPCEPPRQADGLRERRLLMDELRKGVLELVFGMLPPCNTKRGLKSTSWTVALRQQRYISRYRVGDGYRLVKWFPW